MIYHKKKIVLATPLYPPEIGGPATYAQIVMEHLPPQGVEVVLVKFNDVKSLPKILRHIAYFWRVFRAARRADIVFALDPVSVGLPALWAARLTRKPFVVKIVGDYAWEQGRQRFGVTDNLDQFIIKPQHSFFVCLFQKIQTHVARSAVRIIVPSLYLKNVVRKWGLPEGRFVVIHNAIVQEAESEQPESVRRLSLPRIVSAGRLVPWKGFRELIAAMKIVRRDFPRASLAIAGDGADRKTLEQYAESVLHNNYVFTGNVSHAEVWAMMANASVFVLDSLYEGLSHTLVEALICGVPVVVSDIEANREVITDKENGLLISPGDPAVLAQAIKNILSDEKLRVALAAKARTRGADYSPESMIKELYELLRIL